MNDRFESKAKKTTLPRCTVPVFMLIIVAFPMNVIVNLCPLNLKDKITICILYIIGAYAVCLRLLIKRYGVANFMTIFFVLSIPFSYGQHIVAIFNPSHLTNKHSYSILDGLLADDSIINATFFIIVFLMLLLIGYVYSNKFSKRTIREHNISENREKKYRQVFVFVAVMFLIVSIVPAFKELFSKYKLSLIYTYLERRNLESDANYLQLLGVSSIELYIAYWFKPALYMLLIGIRGKRVRVLTYILLVVYCALYMLSGSRFEIIKILLAVFLIEYVWRNVKLNPKQIVKLVFVVIAVLFVLGIVGNMRRGITGSSTIQSSASDILESEIVSSTLWETGITFTSVSNIFDKCPSSAPFFFGKSYLGAILICLPGIFRFGFTDKYTFTTSSTFSKLYYGTTTFGYGSSIYAEQYYNWGYFALVIAIGLGILFGYCEEQVTRSKISENPSKFLLFAFICSELIYSVRNDLYAIPRSVLISVIIPLAIVKIIQMLLVRRG